MCPVTGHPVARGCTLAIPLDALFLLRKPRYREATPARLPESAQEQGRHRGARFPAMAPDPACTCGSPTAGSGPEGPGSSCLFPSTCPWASLGSQAGSGGSGSATHREHSCSRRVGRTCLPALGGGPESHTLSEHAPCRPTEAGAPINGLLALTVSGACSALRRPWEASACSAK